MDKDGRFTFRVSREARKKMKVLAAEQEISMQILLERALFQAYPFLAEKEKPCADTAISAQGKAENSL